MRSIITPFLFVVVTSTVPARASGQEPTPPDVFRATDPVAELLQRRLEATRVTGIVTAAGRAALAPRSLDAFYVDRFFTPTWTVGGRPAPGARALVEILRNASADGLDGRDYHLSALEALLRSPASALSDADAVDIEVLLTDAFLLYGSHLLHGRVDPRTVDPAWRAVRRIGDVEAALRRATRGGVAGAEAVRRELGELAPAVDGYTKMRAILAALREVEAGGGWPLVPAGSTLRPGDSDPRVELLRRRLRFEADVDAWAPDPSTGGDPARFDEALEEAVRDFQLRHGLEADGVVGSRTLAAINVPVAGRIAQTRVNMERWRWLPDDLGVRHIRVNIAAFRVDVMEGGSSVLQFRAVVGRPFRKTPVFSGLMRYLVLAPYWHVPPTIAAVDKFPLIRSDPGYLAAQRMTLLHQGTNEVVDPATVDWSAIESGAAFNRLFRLRQEPGPLNALGDVKFMFPNEYNVYLHDTPSRELFDRSARDFSSGCIRIERPERLVRYLLGEEWSDERIRSVVSAGVERTVNLPSPIPVHLLYFTAYVDENGRSHFLPDIYERDGAVLGSLDADPPAR